MIASTFIDPGACLRADAADDSNQHSAAVEWIRRPGLAGHNCMEPAREGADLLDLDDFAGLMVGFVSALPMLVPLVSYLLVTGMSRLFLRRVWQIPILAMYLVTFIGSLVSQGIVMVVLLFYGTPLPFSDSLNLVILPAHY